MNFKLHLEVVELDIDFLVAVTFFVDTHGRILRTGHRLDRGDVSDGMDCGFWLPTTYSTLALN